MNQIEESVLACFEDSEWHLSLWFPKVARCVVGLPPQITDGDAQTCLLRLLANGVIEAGQVSGAEFVPCGPPAVTAGVDLYLRSRAGAETELAR